MSRKPDVSVVIPVFNEAQNLEALIRRCLEACGHLGMSFEIILVDDGSTDNSADILVAAAQESPREIGQIVAVLLNRNYGQHAAVMAGFEQSKGEMVITLDADLQNPPEEIPKLVNTMEKGFDVVGTVRVPRRDTLFRRMASFTINKVAQKATGVNMHDYGCMLRAYRRPVVNAMLACHERSTFIPILANTFARSTAEIEVRHEARSRGSSKYGLWKLINLQFDLMTSMTNFPLRLLSVMGSVIALLGVGFGLLLFVLRLMHGPEWAAEGVFTLFAVLFVFVGAQFMAMGLLGEYIGRIYHDVRARPRWFVQQVVKGQARNHDMHDESDDGPDYGKRTGKKTEKRTHLKKVGG